MSSKAFLALTNKINNCPPRSARRAFFFHSNRDSFKSLPLHLLASSTNLLSNAFRSDHSIRLQKMKYNRTRNGTAYADRSEAAAGKASTLGARTSSSRAIFWQHKALLFRKSSPTWRSAYAAWRTENGSWPVGGQASKDRC